MKIKEVITLLDEFAPLAYAEDFDNTGLLVGDQEASVTGILVTLDTLEAVVDEAVEKKLIAPYKITLIECALNNKDKNIKYDEKKNR